MPTQGPPRDGAAATVNVRTLNSRCEPKARRETEPPRDGHANQKGLFGPLGQYPPRDGAPAPPPPTTRQLTQPRARTNGASGEGGAAPPPPTTPPAMTRSPPRLSPAASAAAAAAPPRPPPPPPPPQAPPPAAAPAAPPQSRVAAGEGRRTGLACLLLLCHIRLGADARPSAPPHSDQNGEYTAAFSAAAISAAAFPDAAFSPPWPPGSSRQSASLPPTKRVVGPARALVCARTSYSAGGSTGRTLSSSRRSVSRSRGTGSGGSTSCVSRGRRQFRAGACMRHARAATRSAVTGARCAIERQCSAHVSARDAYRAPDVWRARDESCAEEKSARARARSGGALGDLEGIEGTVPPAEHVPPAEQVQHVILPAHQPLPQYQRHPRMV